MHSRFYYLLLLHIFFLSASCRQDKVQSGTCLKSASAASAQWLKSSKHYLPWPSGISYPITQISGGMSHYDKMLYAWDFAIKRSSGIQPGEKVIAAIGGTVAAIKRDSQIVGGGKEAINESNFVFINWDLEDSKEIGQGLLLQSQYRHFHSVSPSLVVGQRISRGAELGIAGCTGWCEGTHLHYEVRNRNTNYSLPIQFVENIPLALVNVVSKNGSVSAPPPPQPPGPIQQPEPPPAPPETPIQEPTPDTFAFQGLCDSRWTAKQQVCLNALDPTKDVLKTMLVNCQEKTSTFCPNICIANSDSSSNDFCGVSTGFSNDSNADNAEETINKNAYSNDATPTNCD